MSILLRKDRLLKKVLIDTTKIKDWGTFHSLFKEAFGFPEFYGMNNNAWIDCMSSLRAPEEGMTTIHVVPDETLLIEITGTKDFISRCGEQFEGLVEITAFVNQRYIEHDEIAGIALVFL